MEIGDIKNELIEGYVVVCVVLPTSRVINNQKFTNCHPLGKTRNKLSGWVGFLYRNWKNKENSLGSVAFDGWG